MNNKIRALNRQEKSAAAKVEYVAILAAVAIGVPLAVTQIPRFIGDRSCTAEAIVDFMSDCIVSDLQAGDHEFVTYQGIAIDMDLTEGAEESFEINSGQSSSLRLPSFGLVSAAHAQGLGQGLGNERTLGSRLPGGGNDARRPGESLRDYINENRRARGLPVDEKVVDTRRRNVHVKEVGTPVVSAIVSGRPHSTIPLGSGRVERVSDERMRFVPGSDFDALRSGEHAVVEFPFRLIGTRDDEAEATARVIVNGFHADNDVATTWGRESIEIDIFANDHLPHLRQQISLQHMVPPARGSVSFANGRVVFTPSPTHAQLKSGQSDVVTFSYTIVGPMGATDTADISVTVNGFSAEPDVATIWQDVPVTIDVLANDHNGQRAGLQLVSVSQPSKGTASIVGDRIRFDPGNAFAGMAQGTQQTVSFSYVVRSPDGRTTANANVSVTVRAYSYNFTYSGWSTCTGGTWGGWSAWSSCSWSYSQTRSRTCDTSGTQSRSVQSCIRSDGASVSTALCDTPVLSRSCTSSCSGSSSESRWCDPYVGMSGFGGGGDSGGSSGGDSGGSGNWGGTHDHNGNYVGFGHMDSNFDAYGNFTGCGSCHGNWSTDSGSSGGGKIVCTAMNAAYGFGSFRQKIWLSYSSRMSEEHQLGYHILFLPLVKHAYIDKGFGSGPLRSVLEHIARHRTADIRAEMKGGRRDVVGRIERAVLEPVCYVTGWLAKRAGIAAPNVSGLADQVKAARHARPPKAKHGAGRPRTAQA